MGTIRDSISLTIVPTISQVWLLILLCHNAIDSCNYRRRRAGFNRSWHFPLRFAQGYTRGKPCTFFFSALFSPPRPGLKLLDSFKKWFFFTFCFNCTPERRILRTGKNVSETYPVKTHSQSHCFSLRDSANDFGACFEIVSYKFNACGWPYEVNSSFRVLVSVQAPNPILS